MIDSKIVELRAYCDRHIADLDLLESHGWKRSIVKKAISNIRKWLTDVSARPTQNGTKKLEYVYTSLLGHTLTLDSILSFLLTHDPSHLICGQYIDLLKNRLEHERYVPPRATHEEYGMMLNVHNYKSWLDQYGNNIRDSETRIAKKVLKQLDKMNIPVFVAELVRSDPT